MNQRYSGVILALLFAVAAAGPINSELFKDSRTCAKRCLDNNKFKYNKGSIYIYEYDATTKTSVIGAAESSANIRMTGTVEIEPTSACDLEMRITQFALMDPYLWKDAKMGTKEFFDTLNKYPLRFSFQDGRIEDLCPHPEEKAWALNIKRGILSNFQNSMKRLNLNQNIVETDVTGTCDTKYEFNAKDGSIMKTKDMVSCKHRHGMHSAVQSIGYDAETKINNLAIIKTEFKCTQKIQDHIIGESLCVEEHIFRPFSNGKNGAATVNTAKLWFVKTMKGGKAVQAEITTRTDLLFHHKHAEMTSAMAAEKIEMKLDALCNLFGIKDASRPELSEVFDDIRPEQPEHFAELIKFMRTAESTTLNAIYKKITSGKICQIHAEKIKKVFHDAIPMVGTSHSLHLIRDLIWKREIVGMEKDMWLASLPFIQNPNREMIAAIKPLLEDKNVEGKTILMVSSLVSGYCKVNPQCELVAEFHEIMEVLSRFIGKCTSEGPYEKTLYALRAIGNIGHSKNIVPRLTQCFTLKETPVELRLAAIDAFRKIPCNAMRVELMDLFTDMSEDAELRINAYIAMMKCPHKNIVVRVEEALRTEKTNQVGSYVWTHISNLQETYDPHMQAVRALVNDVELKTIFNKDNKKFSRNYETSFFLDEINAGGKVDGNLIFSPKSFIPRSANLNLTLDFFGQAINFFEMGTRMEGVERVLESYFGNSAYLKDMKDPLKNAKFPLKDFDDKYTIDVEAMKGYAFMRMFGNELGFWQFEEPNLSFFKNFDIKKWVKNEKIAFHKNMALMDSKLIIPTILGLPLNMDVNAHASIDVEAMGKMNLASLKNIEIGGSIRPSGAVKVVGAMMIDAQVTKAGLTMNGLAHSSSEAKMSFKMMNSKVVESNFELPKKNMEIVTIKTDFHILKGDIVMKQDMIKDNAIIKNKCTGDNFNKVTGMKLCTSFIMPNASFKHDAPYFPLTGPLNMEIKFFNHDAPEGFIMKAHINEATQLGFIIDTPNSKVNRKISFDININGQDQVIVFDSPWKKLAFNGKFVKTKAHKLISGEIMLDHKNKKIDKFSASMQLDFANMKGVYKWTPKMVVMTPHKKMIIDGAITNTGKRVEADLKAAGFFKEEVTFKLVALGSKKEYSCISTFKFGAKEYYLKTKVGMLPKGKAVTYTPEILFKAGAEELIKFDGSFLYNPNAKIIASVKLDKVFSKIVAINARVLMNNNKKKMKHQLMFNVKAPKVNVDVKGNMELKESRITSRIMTTYTIGKYQDKLTISSKLLDESTKTLAKYSADLAVDSKKDIKNNFVLKGVFGKAANHFETKFDLEIGNAKKPTDAFHFESLLNYNLKPVTKAITYSMAFKRPSKNVDVGFKLTHENMHTKKVESNVEVKYGTGKTAAAKLMFNMKNEFNFEGFFSVKHLEKELFRFENKMTNKKAHHYENFLNIIYPGGKKITLESTFMKISDKSFHLASTLRLPTNKEIKFVTKMNIAKEIGNMFIEVNAAPATLFAHPWNPKLNFDYQLKMAHQKIDLLKCNFELALSPKEVIKTVYTLTMPKDGITQDLLITSTFTKLKHIEAKYTNKHLPTTYKETTFIKIDDIFKYEEEYTVKYEKGTFLFDYILKETCNTDLTTIRLMASSDKTTKKGLFTFTNGHHKINFDVGVVHTPNKWDIKVNALVTLPKFNIDLNMKSASMINLHELSFNSNGETKLKHPKCTFDLTYFAKADKKRITFDTNFASPTKHRNAKLAVDIAMAGLTNLMCKVDADYNGKRLYSLNTGYKFENKVHNFQFAFLLPNGERITTVFNLNWSAKKTIHAEIKLPTALGAFELDVNGLMECPTKICNIMLTLNTNNKHFRNLVTKAKFTKMGMLDLDIKFDGIIKNLELVAKLEGETWTKKTILALFKLNGAEKLKLEGNYLITSPKKFNAKFELTSKMAKWTNKLILKAVSDDKGKAELYGMLELNTKKYIADLTLKDFKEIKAKIVTPAHTYEITAIINKLKLNDFDVMATINGNGVQHKLTLVNKHLQEITLTAVLHGYKKFDIIYTGGIDDQKKGTFKLKAAYGEHFIECDSTVNIHNQFELKSNVAFNLLWGGKVHTGSGEVKLTHHMDSIFQKITATFTYGKEKITFSSVIKNTGKINMNIRLKTSMKFSATLKAQIKPDTYYNTDLSLVFDTKWTGAKKLTYSHAGTKGKSLMFNADFADAKAKVADFTMNAKVFLKAPYGFDLEVTTDKMTKKYKFNGELTVNKNLVKGKLHLAAPFTFMLGKPLEITFEKAGAMLKAMGKFRNMEFNINNEFSAKHVMTKAYLNWNKNHEASNFNFEMNFVDQTMENKINKKFDLKLIHPVRTVAFSAKLVKNPNMFDLDIEASGNVKANQKIGFRFGKTHNAGYVVLALPKRTLKFSGRLDTVANKKTYIGAFFWDFGKDDTKKIDLTVAAELLKNNAIFDIVLKFPSQTKGVHLKTELMWKKGDTLLMCKTVFSLNQDPKNVITFQMELLKDINNKYTFNWAIKHPKTGLDFMATFHLFEINHKLTASLVLKYGPENVKIVAYLDKKKNELGGKLNSKAYNAEFFAHLIKGKDIEIAAKLVHGHGKPMEVYINVSPARKNFKIKVVYDEMMPEKSYLIEGNLMTNKMVLVEAFHKNGREKVVDTTMDFHLNDANVLYAKIEWRPTMIMELNGFLYNKMMMNVHKMGMMWEKIYATLVTEGFTLTHQFHTTLKPEVMTIEKYMADEWKIVSTEVAHMFKTAAEMYDRDYLYMHTTTLELKKAFKDIELKIVEVFNKFEHDFRNAAKYYHTILLQKIEEEKKKIDHVYMETSRKLAYDIEQAKMWVMKKASELNAKWIVKRDEYLRKLNEFSRKTYQAFFEHKYTKAAILAVNQKWEELNDFMHKNHMMTPHMTDMINHFKIYIKDIKEFHNRMMHEIKHHPAINDVFILGNEFYQQLIWAYKYWNVEQNLKNMDDVVKNYITKTANGIREQIFSLNEMELIAFDLHSGLIEFKFPVVMPKFFIQAQEKAAKFMRMVKSTVNKFNKWHPEYNYTIADLYYSIKSSANPIVWMPPYKAQASIFRDQHITTFDGVHLDFKGACSYILTRDFVDNHFTVIANYANINNDQKIESILFHAENEKLELFHDYQVRLNDEKVDLPIKLNALSVNRVGKMMEVKSKRGFTITFDPSQGAVVMDISGWYFGKVAGLLGTFNNEQFDEMTVPEKKQVTRLDDFAFSWAMKGCRSTQNFAQLEQKMHKCDHWFLKSSSPFRNCFRQVEPSSFYHVCNTAHKPELDICEVARFYMDRCGEKGVPLTMPAQCMTCKTKRGDLIMAGKEFEYSEKSRHAEIADAADIVFVVEQRKCNKAIVTDLNRIIQGIEQNLRNKGLNDNRYGLVAFGGDNIRPEYSVTIRNGMMASAGLLMNEVRKLDFYDGYSTTDPLKAIHLAAQYPFRMTTRKTIVLVNCNLFCHEKTVSYQNVLGDLKTQDIALHLLQKYTFEISGNKSPKTTDLFGLDSKQVYTKSESGASEKMFETIKLPSGDCAELSLASNGSVFDASKMTRDDMSMFVHRFSDRIADSLEKVNCHVCQCAENEMGMPQSICTRCPSIIPKSSPMYLPGKLFHGNFAINENFKDQLNMYWDRFAKKDVGMKKGKARSRRFIHL